MSAPISMLDAHAEGEIGRVVFSGAPPIPGRTMLDKLNHINAGGDAFRRWLCFEPRGFAQMSANVVLPPTRTDADAAFLVLQPDRAHAMSGSNAICVTTALLESGHAPMREPETTLRLDTPAGLVKARALCEREKCLQVTLDMPPSYVHALDQKLEIAGLGKVRFDLAFGGVFYALVDPAQFALAIDPLAARQLVAIANRAQRAISAAFDIRHPAEPALSGLSYVMFVSRNAKGELLGGTVLPPGRFDRSPCGTGNAARLAVMRARGEAEIGDRFVARSIIGSRFDVELTGAVMVSDRPGVQTRVAGRGFVYGRTTHYRDPRDPFQGHALTDCWGEGLDAVM